MDTNFLQAKALQHTLKEELYGPINYLSKVNQVTWKKFYQLLHIIDNLLESFFCMLCVCSATVFGMNKKR